MSMMDRLKGKITSYIQKNLEQAGLSDFEKDFALEFDREMAKRSQRSVMQIQKEDSDESDEEDGPNVIDMSEAKARMEKSQWSPSQVVRVDGDIMYKITTETVDDCGEYDDPELCYYSWEVSSLAVQITVVGTSSTLDQAKRSCESAGNFVATAEKKGKLDQ